MTEALAGGTFSVVEGRGGRLFLDRYEDSKVLDLYTNEAAIDAGVYRSWRDTLERRTAYFAQHGIGYLNLVVPDAHLVYPDALPDTVALASPTPFQRLQAMLAAASRGECVYPLRELIDGRRTDETFQATDSHWTDWGAYLSYRTAMQALRRHLPDLLVLAPERLHWSSRRSFGALGVGVTPERAENLRIAKVSSSRCRVTRMVATERRDAYMVVEQDRPDLPTALIFRDSFMTNAHKFFSESFRRTAYVSHPNAIFYDLVEQESPDVVIFQTVERRLCKAPREPSLFDFRMMFGDLLMDDPAAVEAQLRSRSLLRGGDAAGALAANDEALARAPATARLYATRAQLYAELGQLRAAAEALRTAVTVDPADGPLWYFLAQALRQLQLFREGAAAAARACRLEPAQPELWSFAVAAALDAEDPAAADELARAGLERHPAHPDLLYAHSHALVALGLLEDAEAAIRLALASQPASSYFVRQLASVLIRRADWPAARDCLVYLQRIDPEAPGLAEYVALVGQRLATAGGGP